MYDFAGYDDWKTTNPDYEGLVSCPFCGEDRHPDERCPECEAPAIEPEYTFSDWLAESDHDYPVKRYFH